MSKIAIATDSNSGITQAQGKELGIFVLPNASAFYLKSGKTACTFASRPVLGLPGSGSCGKSYAG